MLAVAGTGGLAFALERARVQSARDAAAAEAVGTWALRLGELAGEVTGEVSRTARLARPGAPPTARLVPAALADAGVDALLIAPTEPGLGTSGLPRLRMPTGVPAEMARSIETTAVSAALRSSRDAGEPAISAPLEGGSVVVAAPIWRSGALPESTASRRSQLAGYALGVVRAGALARATAPGGIDGWSLVDEEGPALAAAGAELHNATAPRNIPVGDRHWQIVAAPSSAGVPASAVAALVAGLALPALFLAGTAIAEGRARRAREAARSRELEMSLIAEMGSLLQQSLELTDLLPMATTALASALDCDSAGVSIIDERGRSVEQFALGPPGPVPIDAARIPPPPPAIAPGETLFLPLVRSARSIGTLRLRPVHGFDALRMATVRTLGEVIATALNNALLYAREQHTVARLQEVDHLKTTFLATASHELRTPVTAIAGFAGWLAANGKDATPEEREEITGRLARNANALLSLLHDLLDLSRLESGPSAVNLQRLDVGNLLTQLVDRIGATFNEHTIVLEAGTAPLVLADAEAVERILTNLLANATKYSPAGTEVHLRVREQADRAVIVVDDHGPGVPVPERELIFSRFFRGRGDEVLRTRGAGLGLAVVRDLVARLGGRVTVTDNPAGGARFVVELLLATEDEDVEAERTGAR